MQALLSNQSKAIEKLQSLKVGALFMKPGTGKTRAAYELIKSIIDIDFILWLTPFRTKASLLNEINNYGGLNNLKIIGIETLSSSDRIYLELTNNLQKHNSFIVVDESLKIKNWEAKRTKRIIELGKLSQYKLILNGTPLTKNVLDIWAQMEFLSPLILRMGMSEYENTFCEWTKITKQINGRSFVQKRYDAFHNIDYLYSLIKPYVYESSLDLAIKQNYFDVDYQIEHELIIEYNKLKEKYLDNEMLRFMNNNIFLEMTQKMQYIYCCSEDKFLKLDKIISKYGFENILIFCKFVASKKALSFKYPNATILSYGMHSFGLNLQDKHITVYFDKTFDYAQRIQSGNRTYRTGQLNDCLYFDFTGNVGLEKLIDKNISKKISLSEYFKNKSLEEIKSEI